VPGAVAVELVERIEITLDARVEKVAEVRELTKIGEICYAAVSGEIGWGGAAAAFGPLWPAES
jgi:hypothetical protein